MKKFSKWFGIVLIGITFVVTSFILFRFRSITINSLHHYPEDRDPITVSPSDYGMDYESITLTTEDGFKLSAWYVESKNGAAIIAQHGYKSDRTVMLNIASILAEHGYGVIMTDLRAHGESEGDLITFGMKEQLDVDAAYQYLLSRPDVDPSMIGAFGNSMGAATLIMYSAVEPGIKALVAHSSFANLEDTTAKNVQRYTGFPPSALFLRIIDIFGYIETGYTFNDVIITDYIGKLSPRPVFILQGGKDEDSPTDSGQLLFEAAGDPKFLWFEPEQEHVFFDRDYPEEFERRVIQFFDTYLLNQ